jgi:phage gp37-like protein
MNNTRSKNTESSIESIDAVLKILKGKYPCVLKVYNGASDAPVGNFFVRMHRHFNKCTILNVMDNENASNRMIYTMRMGGIPSHNSTTVKSLELRLRGLRGEGRYDMGLVQSPRFGSSEFMDLYEDLLMFSSIYNMPFIMVVENV